MSLSAFTHPICYINLNEFKTKENITLAINGTNTSNFTIVASDLNCFVTDSMAHHLLLHRGGSKAKLCLVILYVSLVFTLHSEFCTLFRGKKTKSLRQTLNERNY